MKIIKNNLFMLFVFLFCSILFSSCSLVTGTGQSQIEYQDLVLYDGVTYGQSFYAKHNGLQSFNIFIQPDKVGDGNIIVRLRNSNSDSLNLELIQINRNSIKNAGYYNFQFSAPYKSYLKGYYVLIDYDGSGSVILGSANQSSYDDGAGYFNGASFPRQLVFSLSYAPIPMFLALLKLFFTKWIFWIILSILLYILPGYALLTILKIQFQHTSFMEKVIFSIGISLAITPILFLWTNIIGLNLGLFYALGPVILSFLYFVYIFIKNKKKIKFSMDRYNLKGIDIADVIFVFLIVLLIISRFWIIRALPLPLWGDSYQHTLITQLLFENKGLFQSWAPYTDIPNFTYHFGFHSNAVNFQWLSQETAAQAVMIFGQIINIFAVIVLYPLAVYISPKKRKLAGLIAVFIGGFLLNMPNFYTNWGRYTQLIGQVILIPLVLLIWKILDEEKTTWKNGFLAAIMLTGLALSHYRILIVFALFVPVIIIFSRKNNFKKKIIKIGLIGLSSFVLFLPWFINAFAGNMVDLFFNIFHASQVQLSNSLENSFVKISLESIGFYNYVQKGLLLLIVLSIVYFIYKREYDPLKVFIWWLLVFVVGFPQLFHLPGKDILSGFAVLISLYIPIGIILGAFFSIIFENLKNSRKILYFILLIVIIPFSLWFFRQRLYDIDSKTYGLATFPDLKAAQWISENIKDDKNIYINNFPAYNDTVFVGSDAGWWLPFLTKKQVNVPPLNYGFELNKEIKKDLINNAFKFWDFGLASDVGITMLRQSDIKHIFIGQKQGSVNSPDQYRLDFTALDNSGKFELIYQEDYIRLYSLNK